MDARSDATASFGLSTPSTRRPTAALEQGRVLIGAGLFREADHELAAAMRRAHQERQGHTYADALQLRAAAALLADQPVAAAD